MENVDNYRRTLEEMRERLRDDIQARVDAVLQKMKAPGDVSDAPTHAADHDAEGIAAEVEAGRVQQRELAAVDAALKRIELGTFGRCVKCGAEISPPRLNDLPYVETCRSCAK